MLHLSGMGDTAYRERLGPGESGGDPCSIVGLDLVEYEEAGVLKKRSRGRSGGSKEPDDIKVFFDFPMRVRCREGRRLAGGEGTRAGALSYSAICTLTTSRRDD